MTDLPDLPGLTEDDLVRYLLETPEFFERQAELLARVQLASPHRGSAIGLQERQAILLRDRIRTLEQRVGGMVRHGIDNTAIADRLHRWTLRLLAVRDAAELPARAVAEARAQFQMPQAALRLWDLAPAHAGLPCAQDAGAEARDAAAAMAGPYCGPNHGFPAAQWLDDPAQAASVALLPLRAPAPEGLQDTAAPAAPVFGLMVLASPEADRFRAEMGTDFLERMADCAGAALARLRGAAA
ncbi:MAG: DUF484 family protein [Xylophilus ampelinus]